MTRYATNKRKQGHHATMASYRQQTVVASYLATVAMADDGVLPTGLVAAEFSSGGAYLSGVSFMYLMAS